MREEIDKAIKFLDNRRFQFLDYDFDEEVEYTIVGSAEADPMNFKISNESPVGKGLIGKKVGDIVEVNVPDGVSKFEVLDIRRA